MTAPRPLPTGAGRNTRGAGSVPGEGVPCECGRGDVAVAVFQRGTSLLVRRIGDMGHHSAADWRCIDCVADAAVEVAANGRRSWHPDFGGPGMAS